MPTLRVPAVINYYTDRKNEIRVSGSTVLEAMQDAVNKYPALKFHVFDDQGNIRRHFNFFVNDVHVRELDGLQTKVKEGDVIRILASAAGGSFGGIS